MDGNAPLDQQLYALGRALAEGWEDLPWPSDSIIEAVIDGEPVRVLLCEPPRDPG